MEDRKLNEKESLELITQMIQNTRRNLDAGGGNMFLLWGYVGVVVTLGVLAAWSLTENTVALWGFWALPVVGWLLSWWFGRKWRKEQRAKDYTDRIVRQVWQIIGIASCGVAGFATLYHSYEMILPLCGLLVSLGSLLTVWVCLEPGAGFRGGNRWGFHGHADYFCPYFAVFIGYSRSCVEPSCAKGCFRERR